MLDGVTETSCESDMLLLDVSDKLVVRLRGADSERDLDNVGVIVRVMESERE